MKRIISLFLILSMLLAVCPVFAADEEFERIIERVKEDVVASFAGETSDYYYASYDASWLDIWQNDGTFSDMDYTNGPDRFDHLKRLVALAAEYSFPEKRLYRNPDVRSKLVAGFSYYVNAQYDWVGGTATGTSGWDNWLAAPTVMTEIMMLMEASEIEISQSVREIARSHYFSLWEDRTTSAYRFCTATANLPVTVTLWKNVSALYNEIDLMMMVFDFSYEDWIDFSDGVPNFDDGETAENSVTRFDYTHYLGGGIYPDGSFFFHGAQPYLWGYGNQFISGTMNTIKYAAGTKYAAPSEKLGVLANLLLDGFAWAVRGDQKEFYTIGRSIEALDGGNDRLRNYAQSLLVEPNMPRRDELEALIEKIENDTEENQSYVEGNKAYWFSDMINHHREKFFAHQRSTSNRIIRSETLGDQGTNNYYASNGLAIYVDGYEYADITTAWDWDRLPGLTAVQTDGNVPEAKDMYGYNSFVGVASDGEYGVSTSDYYDPEGEVNAKKSWFFFDDEVVALATDISSISGKPLLTSMNQTRLDGEVSYSVNGEIKTLNDESTVTLDEVDWIYQGKVGYIAPEQKITFSNKSQTGNGLRIGVDKEGFEYETHKIFSAGIEHGTAPKNESYSYILVPGVDQNYVADYANNMNVEILRNDSEIQAVYNKKSEVLQAVFRKAGDLEYGDGLKISVDKPCIIMVRKTIGGYQITMQNPKQEYMTVNFGINEKLESSEAVWSEADGMLYLPITTGKGVYLGQSVVKYLLSDMTCEMNYNEYSNKINVSGLMPFTNVEKIFVKMISETGKSTIFTEPVNSDYTYSLDIDTSAMLGNYKLSVYTAGNTEPIEYDVSVTKSDKDTVIFADTANHWVRDYAARLGVAGIIKGDNNSNVNPDDNISYEELLRIVSRVIKYKKPNLDMTVEGESVYADEIAYVMENNILPQYITDGFNPQSGMSREDMITCIMAMAENAEIVPEGTNTAEPPLDMGSVTYRCYGSMQKAWNAGLINGDGTGVKPFDIATRGEVIKIVDMILSN